MVRVVLKSCFLRLESFLLLLILAVPLLCFAAESSPTLTVTTMDAHLYARQDNESKFIAPLEKGEKLQPFAQGLGNGDWYMVKTSKGMIGWVQSADVSGSNNGLDETFRDRSEIKPPTQPTGFLAQCLAHADEAHQDNWNRDCKLNGKPARCALPTPTSDTLKRDHRAARDECIKLYGITKMKPSQ